MVVLKVAILARGWAWTPSWPRGQVGCPNLTEGLGQKKEGAQVCCCLAELSLDCGSIRRFTPAWALAVPFSRSVFLHGGTYHPTDCVFHGLSPLLACEPREGSNFCLFCSLLSPLLLEQ